MTTSTTSILLYIQFTIEEESDNKIAFLDVLAERKGTMVLISVYSERRHTNYYLNFEFYHHPK